MIAYSVLKIVIRVFIIRDPYMTGIPKAVGLNHGITLDYHIPSPYSRDLLLGLFTFYTAFLTIYIYIYIYIYVHAYK